MAAYATWNDVQNRMTRSLSDSEKEICTALLDDAAVIIDAFNINAAEEVKLIVSCRMVQRTLGDGSASGYPMGATQGSISALGYSQSWTMGASGTNGELYLSKIEKKLLGLDNKIGSYSPVQDRVRRGCHAWCNRYFV